MIASENGHAELCGELVELGADPNLLDRVRYCCCTGLVVLCSLVNPILSKYLLFPDTRLPFYFFYHTYITLGHFSMPCSPFPVLFLRYPCFATALSSIVFAC